ncbi:MAG: hypothetical protein QG635_1331 [Bacteroidota bacterium]|nr:hypothetical protein [Bacteroidota bacterium]
MINLSKIRNRIKPVTYFDELAEIGALEDYLKTYFPDKYKNDKSFRQEMLGKLAKTAKKPVHDLEIHYLEKVCETLSYFLEYTKPWRNR